MINIAGRGIMSFQFSGVATTRFNARMSEGSGSVKRLFGCRRGIAPTDVAGIENVSRKRFSVDLNFDGLPEVMDLPAMGSTLS